MPKIGEIRYVGVTQFPIVYDRCPDCNKLGWSCLVDGKPKGCCKDTAEDILLRYLWDAH